MRMGQYAPMFPRTALVTGGASGIGAAIVDLLREERVDVQALDLANGFDVSDAQAWETVRAVELACLNAGVTTGEHDVSRLSDDAYRRILGANLDGVVFGVRRLADVMEPGSAIIATASLAGLVPSPADPIYTLTKHAVIGFVRSVAPQLEERGIRINAVAPGFVETPILATVPDKVLQHMREQVPLHRLGKPEEIANVYAFLASDEASYVNGAVIEVSGGMTV